MLDLQADRRRLSRPAVILMIVAVLAGCAGPAVIRHPAATGSLGTYPPIAVPFYSQKAYQCGPAALAMVLAWSGVAATPQMLVPEVFTPSRKGSLQSALVAAARRHDRIAYPLTDPESLVAEIAAGHPVVVLQNRGLAWYPVWHYAVVIGLDFDGGTVTLHSGTTPNKQVALKTFERTWARSEYWGLLVLPPSRLPAMAVEKETLRSIGQLERLGRWDVAAQAYQSALQRWPDSLPASMGLGVCEFELGNLESAEAVLRAAAIKFPREGVVFNNLAQVLLAQGRVDQAAVAARRAVGLGGPLKSHFETTLQEILHR